MTRYLLRTVCMLALVSTLLASTAFAAGVKGVVLNFNEVDISTMVKFISDLTGKNFILDDRVKGKISVYSPSKLTTEEAYNVFTSVLELKGFTVVQSGKVAKIVPSASAKQSGFKLLRQGELAPVNESYVAQVTKLEYITAQEAVTFLQPMISKDGHLSAFGPGNLLLMVDSSINIRKLHGILQTIDTERTREGLEIIYLKNASAESAATTVKQWLSGSDGKSIGQPATAAGGSTTSVLADQRLNALLIFGNEPTKKAIRELVAKLDVTPPEASSKVNVYYLENTDATEMAKVLDGVVKGISAQATSTPGSAAPQASAFDSGKVTITPDKASNSLVIMASPNDYTNLVQVIKKLDRRSKQVFVQVVIAEISLNKTNEIGLQAGLAGGGNPNNNLMVAGMFDPFGSLSTVSSLLTTAGISSTGSPINVTAVLKALDSKGLLNVLSTPNILTTDNKEAEIFVGENVPFGGSSTISGTLSTTSVERKDVGINLKLKAQVSEGDYIRLDINQEISDVSGSVTVGTSSTELTTTKRSAKTNVVVKNNETVVIGGLIKDKENQIVNKVPFLGDIPGLGWLFKTRSKTKTKTNLMILLTPHIIQDAKDLAAISDGQRLKFGEAANSLKPVDVQKEISGK